MRLGRVNLTKVERGAAGQITDHCAGPGHYEGPSSLNVRRRPLPVNVGPLAVVACPS